jgi:hypothetical protein
MSTAPISLKEISENAPQRNSLYPHSQLNNVIQSAPIKIRRPQERILSIDNHVLGMHHAAGLFLQVEKGNLDTRLSREMSGQVFVGLAKSRRPQYAN